MITRADALARIDAVLAGQARRSAGHQYQVTVFGGPIEDAQVIAQVAEDIALFEDYFESPTGWLVVLRRRQP